MNCVLSAKWSGLQGISIVSIGINSVTASAEDEAALKELQRSAVFRNPGMAAAHMVQAQVKAMKQAASNANGAMMGFMGMNIAQSVGGSNENSLFQMDQPSIPQKKDGPAAVAQLTLENSAPNAVLLKDGSAAAAM